MTETFASVYLASATPGTVITFLHGVTGPVAVRTLLPYLPPEEQRRLLRYTWQAGRFVLLLRRGQDRTSPFNGTPSVAR